MAGDGISVTVDELMRLRAEARRLRRSAPRDAAGPLPDLYHSLHRGRGLEVDEVRVYQPGDDFRSIDWRVTARSGKLHTKLFLEEREHALFIAVDAGPSMRFGSRVAFKWVAAARAAALLGWLAVDDGDRVGGMVFGHRKLLADTPPGSSLAPLFKILEQASPPPAEAAAGAETALRRLRALAHHGSVVVLFSDAAGWGEAETASLGDLARRNDVALVMLSDPLEEQAPPPGRWLFGDGRATALLDSADAAVRRDYQARFTERRDALRARCAELGVRFCRLSTEHPPAEALRDGLLRGCRHG